MPKLYKNPNPVSIIEIKTNGWGFEESRVRAEEDGVAEL